MKRMIELLDKPYPWKIIQVNPDAIYYKFNIDDTTHYKVVFMSSDIHQDNIINILTKKGYDYNDIMFDCFEIHFARVKNIRGRRRDTDEITGSGNEFTIFTTIFEILKHGIKRFDPTYLSIISKISDPSRMKLYKFFAMELQRKIDYTYIGKEEVNSVDFGDRDSKYLSYYLIKSDVLT